MKLANSPILVDDKDLNKIKNRILGRKYELSLVFAGDSFMKRLNRVYRGKNLPANVLSFPLSENSGEIFINPSKTGGFNILHLFIHGILHLKGMEHGDIMSKTEKKILHGASNHHGH